ncbi:ABC transporter permease [Peptostreptococcus sp. D1]|uniref:ABC transporter permease n=1 Tax=Peptostreptococcus sp. D1 TaxID=72304 RepID=UPI0008F0BE4B|nr:ABC transporter permease [Peptostreptococcus sp. D1]SFE43267.1 putative ABC transport system permease protein [Peptostreptococcus sp. D1]
MKKAVNTNIYREFRNTKKRLISIIVLIFLGVLVFVGLKSSGGDIRKTALDNIYKSNLADAFVMSNVGLDQFDISTIKSNSNIKKLELVHSSDLMIKNSNDAIRVMNIPAEISKLELVEGKFPEKAGQILLDCRLKNDYKIGEQIFFDENSLYNKTYLKSKRYTITGFVNSMEYIDSFNLGYSTAGNGKLKFISYVKDSEFDMDFYSMAKIKYDIASYEGDKITKSSEYDFSKEYRNFVEVNNKQLKRELSKNAYKRLEKFNKNSLDTFAENEKNILEEKMALDAKKRDLALLQEQLKKLENEFLSKAFNNSSEVESFSKRLNDIRDKITKTKTFINNNKNTIEAKWEYIQGRRKDLNDSLKAIANVKYSVMGRDDYIVSYSTYWDGSYKIDTLSNAFPVFFFAVALLVTLSTMIRMVDEQRLFMGTMKAMGYSDIDIIKKYVYYGLFSGTIGWFFGMLFGAFVLPKIIFISYGHNYIFKDASIVVYWRYIFEALLLSLTGTTFVSIFVAMRELNNKPVELLGKKAPKHGSRILLERITFVWHKMSFNNKVTARNIFRYKIRMMMTVLGVSGCTALLVIGMGIKDSISGVSDIQFKQLSKYDIISIYNNHMSNEDSDKYKDKILHYENVSYVVPIFSEKVSIKLNDGSKDTANIFVTKGKNDFYKLINLRDRKTKKTLKISDLDVVVTEKLYNLMLENKIANTSVENKQLTVYTEEDKAIDLKLNTNTEWYTGHNIFMSEKYYEKAFGKKFKENAFLVKLKNPTDKNIDNISKKIMAINGTSYLVTSRDNAGMINSALDGLNFIVFIMIICSLMLAYTVLYNLTNINISERKVELATIKVLGFYPKEVSMYIFKETFLLTIMGIAVGVVLGAGMHHYIIQNLTPNDTMFLQGITIKNIVFSMILTIIFALIVMRIMHTNINDIDMLDSLKSNDQ